MLINLGLFLFPLTAGLLSSFTHCIGMCGPLQLGIQLHTLSPKGVFLFHAGRWTTYVTLGLLGGWLGQTIHWSATTFHYTWIYLLLAALYFSLSLNMAFKAYFNPEKWLLPLLAPLKKIISSKKIKGNTSHYLSGVFAGLLPCPTTFAVLVWTLSLPSFYLGGLGMLFLGFGTLPMFITLLASSRLKNLWNHRWSTVVFSLLFLSLGVWNFQKFISPEVYQCHTHSPLSYGE